MTDTPPEYTPEELEAIAEANRVSLLVESAGTSINTRLIANLVINAAALHEAAVMISDVPLIDSVNQACETYPFLATPVFLLLYDTWNDVLSWASTTAGRPAGEFIGLDQL
jgi:hypothetical protein